MLWASTRPEVKRVSVAAMARFWDLQRPRILHAAVFLVALVVYGCGDLGSSSDSSASSDDQALQKAATITLSTPGLGIVEKLSFGALALGSEGAPPLDVLGGCGAFFASQSSVERNGYARGVADITMPVGELPQDVELNPGFRGIGTIGSLGLLGVGGADSILSGHVIAQIDGEWTCEPTTLQLVRGQHLMVPFWVILINIHTNTRPRPTQDELNLVTFRLFPVPTPGGIQRSAIRAVGPQVSACDDGAILPFAAFPFDYDGTSCQSKAPDGTVPPHLAAEKRACAKDYPDGQHSSLPNGGTFYDHQASMFQVVCEGFGAPESLQLSSGMKCALIGAAFDTKPVGALCDSHDVLTALRDGSFAGLAGSAGCDYFGGMFAKFAGVTAAGASSLAGPGAVAVGVGTYKALSAGVQVACGGLLDGGATSLGTKLEADNEYNIAVEVENGNRCLVYQPRPPQSPWRSASC